MNKEMLLTAAQVSDRIQIDVHTVTRWLRTGYLRGYKFGRYWRIAPDDLDTFLGRYTNKKCKDSVAPIARESHALKAHGSDTMADAEQFKVQIRPFEFQPIKDARYLKVRTYPRPTDRTIRLGLIEWVEEGYRNITYKMLVNRRPMSHKDAMEYAKRFAERFKVPVIYQREDDPVTS